MISTLSGIVMLCMDEAVKAAASYADEGDYVLLSPACASWGMFENFEVRGKVFKSCVMAL